MTAKVLMAPHIDITLANSYCCAPLEGFGYQPPYYEPYFVPYWKECRNYYISNNAPYSNFSSNADNAIRTNSPSSKPKNSFTIASIMGWNKDDCENSTDDQGHVDQNSCPQRLSPEPVYVPSARNSDEPPLLEAVSPPPNSYISNEFSNLVLPSLSPELHYPYSNCKSQGKETRPKRIRTIFTPGQLERLELEFEKAQYLVGVPRLQLASELGLTDSQVKIWFQNRRIKERKQYRETQQAKVVKENDYDSHRTQSELSNGSEVYSPCSSSDDSSDQ